MTSAREAAFLALYHSFKDKAFLEESLESWERRAKPTFKDFQFAKEISFGSARMALALDFLASKLTAKGKLRLGLKEKALLHTAFYQKFYMSKVPLYAIVDESVELAKKHTNPHFSRFLNAILRKLEAETPVLPQGNTLKELSIRYSYPVLYVEELCKDYGEQETYSILEAGNTPSRTMFRIRVKTEGVPQGASLVSTNPAYVAQVEDSTILPMIAKSDKYYIQNAAPATLMARICSQLQTRSIRKILDLCCSPGGKLLSAHDYFPEAQIFGNDLSKRKVNRISQNLQKYGISATLTCGPGELYTHADKFDLIILDLPCSNTGVLNKRPEARWRLNEESLQHLEELQAGLLEHACTLLAPQGTLLYMTCSILKRENEKFIEKHSKRLGLQTEAQEIILPNNTGWDGGFACALKKSV